MAVSHRLSAYVLFLLLPLIQSQGCSVNNAKPLVRENNSAGLVVTNITKAAGITVTISPTADGNCFSIRDTELILSCSLDYEKQDIYILTLLCTQGNVQVDSLEVIVTVVNLNDNSPVFKQPNFTVNVPEDTRVNAIVLSSDTVSATDLDQDTIYYELRGTTPEATEFFNIQGVNNPGIYLLKALDYDKNKSMQLVLLARDRAPGSVDTNTANATITINIQQADTKPPWFLPCKPVAMSSKVCLNTGYIGRINISEQTMEPLNLKPGPLYAIDPDYTLNEKIVYSIIEGNTDDVFLLNYDTGNLTMNKAVNTPETFILHVMATQANSIEKYALTTVEIKVINRSIHAPYFEHVNYTGTVSTGLIRNSLVMEAGAPSKPLKIFAADDDFPNKINPHITYSIQNSSDFTVTQDGLVLTNSVLSSAMKITMLATAIDLASLQEASTIITIEVIPPKGTTLPTTTITVTAGTGSTTTITAGTGPTTTTTARTGPTTTTTAGTGPTTTIIAGTGHTTTSTAGTRLTTTTTAGTGPSTISKPPGSSSVFPPKLTTTTSGAGSGPTQPTTSSVSKTVNTASISGPTGKPTSGTASGPVTHPATTKPSITHSTKIPTGPSESGTTDPTLSGTSPPGGGVVQPTALMPSQTGGPGPHPTLTAVASGPPRPSDPMTPQTSFTKSHQTDVNKMSDYKYTAQDMGILGGTLAALLILALFFLGFIFYKVHRNSVTTISKRKLLQDSFRSNDSYQDDEENPARSTGESELPRSNSSSNASPALQKHSESFQPLETMIASSLGATSATVNKEQEEKDKGAHDTDNEKEVKSILTKDRKPANDGYKAVWFNPDAKEEVMVIEDAPEEEEDGNDRDRNEGKENRDDDDNDDSNNQDSHPGDPVVSFIPLRANYGTPDQDTTTGGEGENILL
ncbi:cadherin-related family member 5 isoform X1 [Alligator mississippiensis]|uniref:Cadherin-related family member 5 isoform A n=1 Tax=Alligator mississippiensis TaxID=8496 RepID=A0A151NY66_ALLMI|nr:cadherin-related family member 5 isoform X1 [Alligator mississippiensis]KYO41539.1 cadherin-related family member 5 isoform A [Alligator mississippiensis]